MTTLISYGSDRQQVEGIANFLQSLGAENLTDECLVILKSDRKQKDRELLILTKILEHQDLLWKKASEKDIEGYYYLVSLLLKKLTTSVTSLLPLLLNSIKNDKNDRTSLRLSLLKGVFNCYAESTFRELVYKTVLEYSLEANLTYLILSELDHLEKVIEDWNIQNPTKRDLYCLAIQILSNRDSEKTLQYISKYLESINDDFGNFVVNIKQYVLYLIKNDKIYTYGFLNNLPSVKSLESGCPPLFALFNLFLEGDYNEFSSFCSKNQEFLITEGIDLVSIDAKFRILRLSDLASTKQVLRYEEIAETLAVNIDDVEYWVVNAISKKILNCKLDQLENIVIIRKSYPRLYRNENWVDLDNKLDSWRNNLQNLLKKIENAKQTL